MGVGDRASTRIVAVAARLLPAGRDDWALAMRAEHRFALDADRGLPFAVGCLAAAVRAHLVRPKDRVGIVRSTVAVTVLVPLAAFHLGCAWGSVRFALGGQDRFDAALRAGTDAQRSVAAGYEAAAPLFGALLLALACAHLAAAWHLMRFRAAPLLIAMASALVASVGLAITILAVMGDWTGIAVQFAGLGVESVLLAVTCASAQDLPLDAFKRRSDR